MAADASGEIEFEEDPNYFIFKNEVSNVVKMHVQPLDLKDWIRIDKSYPAQLNLKKIIFQEQMQEVYVSSDWESTRITKEETLDMLVSYLPARFPTLFESSSGGGIRARVSGEVVGTPDSKEDPLIQVPESNAILFTIRTYQRRLEDFRDLHSSDSQALIDAIDCLDEDMAVYNKGEQFWKDASCVKVSTRLFGCNRSSSRRNNQEQAVLMTYTAR
mmetsp:Transcript_15917/g.28552  ORF Transcript_15917/g.28552 Transcript_15917/m.28552 type:complete len:216 (+) Transcript_15917:98-745(+)